MSSHLPSQMTLVRSRDFAGQLTAALLTARLPLACAAWVMAALMAVGSKAESRPAAAAVRHSRLSAPDCAASALGMLLAARKAGEQRSWGRWMSKTDACQPSRVYRGTPCSATAEGNQRPATAAAHSPSRRLPPMLMAALLVCSSTTHEEHKATAGCVLQAALSQMSKASSLNATDCHKLLTV